MNLSAVGFSFITLVSCFLSLSVLLQFNGLFSPSTRHMRSDSVFIEAASCLFQAQVLFIFFVFHPHIESCSYAIKTNTNSLCVWSKVSGDSVHMHRHDTIQDTSFIINKATNAGLFPDKQTKSLPTDVSFLHQIEHNFKQCTMCGEPIILIDNQTWVGISDCRIYNIIYNICQICQQPRFEWKTTAGVRISIHPKWTNSLT